MTNLTICVWIFFFLKIPNGLCVSFDLSIKISNLNETNVKVTYVSELALQSIYAFSFNPRSLSPHLSLSLSRFLSISLSLPLFLLVVLRFSFFGLSYIVKSLLPAAFPIFDYVPLSVVVRLVF